jgi:hypothetical protein
MVQERAKYDMMTKIYTKPQEETREMQKVWKNPQEKADKAAWDRKASDQQIKIDFKQIFIK